MIFGLSAHISLPIFRENHLDFVGSISIVTATTAALGGLLFTQSFIGITRSKYPRLTGFYKFLAVIALAIISIQLINMLAIDSLSLSTNISYVAALIAMCTSLLNFSVGLILWKKELLARLYFFTNLPMIASAIAYTFIWFLVQKELIIGTADLRLIIYIGMTLQMVLFSVFVGYKIQKAEKQRIALEHRINKKLKDEVEKQTRSLKKAMAELETQRNELKETNELKNKLFSLVAHDLRNPLQNLSSLVDLMGDHVLEPKQIKEFTEQTKLGLSESLMVMERLLYWSSKQLEGIQVQKEVCDLNKIISELKKELNTNLTNKKVSIESSLKIEKVSFDKDMLRVVLRNLISNAIKFSYEGSKIKISSDKRNYSAHLVIQDFGVGMNPSWYDDLIKSGKPDVKKGTKGEKGNGFGLLITKDFVEMNDGTLRCESVEGQGTSFTIEVPVSKSSNS